MKSKFNFFLVIFSMAFLITNAQTEKKKEFHKKWVADSIKTLNVVNKFGEVKINNNGGSDITIDVVVTVEAYSESRTAKLLNQIEVDFSKNGSMAKAVTKIEDDFNGEKKINIDYTINIPPDKNLDIENKYGNVIINELNAKGNFKIEYGSLTANQLIGKDAGDIFIDLGYSKASIETLSDATLDISYSQSCNITDARNLKVKSSYSHLTIGELKSINLDSKYDTYNFEEVGSVIASIKYTQIKIEELKKALKLNSGYGSIKVEEVSSGFESINVENNYGAVSLGIGDNVSYNVKASCDYCDIDYNSEKFKGNRISENHSKNIEGKIGTGASTAKVVITSRYGGIKLR